jgi:hypothetical protein
MTPRQIFITACDEALCHRELQQLPLGKICNRLDGRGLVAARGLPLGEREVERGRSQFTEELSFLSESDKDWVMGRAIVERLKWT